MNKLKKLLLTLLITALTIPTLTVMASSQTHVLELDVFIEATVISATVPLKIDCVINPNAKYEDAFTSPVYKIKNEINSPIGVSLKLANGNKSLEVVKPETYSNWNTLDQVTSGRKIALGIEDKGWFEYDKSIDLGELKAGQSLNYKLKAEHGMAFREGTKFDYRMITVIELL